MLSQAALSHTDFCLMKDRKGARKKERTQERNKGEKKDKNK
jgi:hypothetical protein